MVYAQNTLFGRIMGLSSPEVIQRLGITKITLYKWISQGILRPKRYRIGQRFYTDFDPAEIEQVKKNLLPKSKRPTGKSPFIKEPKRETKF